MIYYSFRHWVIGIMLSYTSLHWPFLYEFWVLFETTQSNNKVLCLIMNTRLHRFRLEKVFVQSCVFNWLISLSNQQIKHQQKCSFVSSQLLQIKKTLVHFSLCFPSCSKVEVLQWMHINIDCLYLHTYSQFYPN